MVHDFVVSWETLHRDARALAWKLAEGGSWQRLIAVTRGGLVPAAVVARELDLRLIDTFCVKSYDHQDQGALTVLKGVSGDGSGCLVIDDLADTGQTVRTIRQVLPKATVATLYVKPLGRPVVDVFVTEVSQDTWIHFPWDLELRYHTPVHQQKAQQT